MDQVSEVKQKTDIVTVVGERIKLKKAGRNYRALCPFHGEKSPSFMVSPELQIYKCFGCARSGDVFTFLQEFEGMDFVEALNTLAISAGVELKQLDTKAATQKQNLQKANELAAKFYHWVLLNHNSAKGALMYLTKEREMKLTTIKTFQIGFAPESPKILSQFLVNKKQIDARVLEQSGLIVKTSRGMIDRFRGRIIFPLFDHRGNYIGLAGRVMPGIKHLAKYINSPETPIYHKSSVLYGLNLSRSEIKKAGFVILVEGELDMIVSWQVGVKNIVALKGTAMTTDQAKILSRITRRITIALDSDPAGVAAARRSIAIAQTEGLEVRVVPMSKYKDPDEFARKDPTGYKKVIKNAIEIWDFIIDSEVSKYDLSTGTGKARVSKQLVPVLSEIEDKIVQAHYIGVVANKLSVPNLAVATQLEGYRKNAKKSPPPKLIIQKNARQQRQSSRRGLLEKRLMALVLQKDPLVLAQKKYSKLFEEPFNLRIIGELESSKGDLKKFSIQAFSEALAPELREGFADVILLEEDEFEDLEKLEKEISQVTRELKKLTIKDKMDEMAKKISKLEEQGSEALLNEAQRKFSALALKMANLKV